MFQQLSKEGIKVPDGFATSAEAYWHFIEENDLKEPIKDTLNNLDKENLLSTSRRGLVVEIPHETTCGNKNPEILIPDHGEMKGKMSR